VEVAVRPLAATVERPAMVEALVFLVPITDRFKVDDEDEDEVGCLAPETPGRRVEASVVLE